VPSIAAVEPVHVATWIEESTRQLSGPSVKQRLAALRHPVRLAGHFDAGRRRAPANHGVGVRLRQQSAR
jgi:hypothetical protein